MIPPTAGRAPLAAGQGRARPAVGGIGQRLSRDPRETPLSAGMLVAWAVVAAIAIAAVPLTLSIQRSQQQASRRKR